MKSLIAVILAILCYIASVFCCLWVLVEFIIYLVKDHPFNAWSIYSTIITLVAAFILHGLSVLFQYKHQKIQKELLNKNQTMRKSKWQQRMDEIKAERNNAK